MGLRGAIVVLIAAMVGFLFLVLTAIAYITRQASNGRVDGE